MWQWFKSNIIKPVNNYFSGIFTRVSNFFTGESQRQDQYQPILSEQPQQDASEQSGSEQTFSMYEQLPNKLHVEIFKHLNKDQPVNAKSNFITRLFSQRPVSAQSALIKTSSRFYNLFQPKRLVDQLIQYIVYGNQNKAEVMIKANPDLLKMKGEAVDYSGRIIKGTALQAALGAEDVKYHDDEECMVEMIIKHLKKLPRGNEIIQQQIAGQFPEGWEQAEDERKQRDTVKLNAVIDSIGNSQDGDDCEAAIQAFRDYLDGENKGKVFGAGKHFNHQLLVEAFNLYNDNYDQFGGGESRQNNLCWRKVIGYIQRYIPAATAQAFCQGVYSIIANNEKLSRVLNFRYSGGVYYPLDSSSDFRLGYNFAGAALAVAPWTAGRWHVPGWRADGRSWADAVVGSRFQNLCQTKTSILGNLCRQSRIVTKRLGV